MRKLSQLSRYLVILALFGAPTAALADEKGEAKLVRALEGKVAGPPVSCVDLRDIRSSRVIDRTAILYRMRNGDLYLNRPDNGAQSLRRSRILVTESTTGRLCDIDVVKLTDEVHGFPAGVVFLGKFVPYRDAARDGRR